jgi:hypothetical protein
MGEIIKHFNLTKWYGFLIASLGFFGYFIAYTYETSYASYFSIPDYLIKISIESIIRSILTLTVLFVGILCALTSWYPLIRGVLKFKKLYLLIVLPFLFYLYREYNIFYSSTKLVELARLILAVVIAYVIAAVGYYAVKFLVMKLGKKLIKPELRSRIASKEFDQSVDFHNYELGDILLTPPVSTFFLLALVFSFVYFITVIGAWHDAEHQKRYLSFARSDGKYILIRNYSPYIALKVKNNKITHDFLLINNTDNINFKSEYYPNLKIEKCECN